VIGLIGLIVTTVHDRTAGVDPTPMSVVCVSMTP
jgi:hypothetical protein